jgi:hypothetical protein
MACGFCLAFAIVAAFEKQPGVVALNLAMAALNGALWWTA